MVTEASNERKLQQKLDLRRAQGPVASGDRERIEREIERELTSLTPVLTELQLNDELVELLNAAGRTREAVERLVSEGNDGAAADLARETQQWALAGEILEFLQVEPRRVGKPLSRSAWPFDVTGQLSAPKFKLDIGGSRSAAPSEGDEMPTVRQPCVPDIKQLQ